jgi:multicomponent K+:H+ antiporter subunit D
MGAFFLLIELVERGQDATANVPAVTVEAYGEGNESDEEDEEVGIAFPGTIAALGISLPRAASCSPGCRRFPASSRKFAILPPCSIPKGSRRTGRSRRYRGGL